MDLLLLACISTSATSIKFGSEPFLILLIKSAIFNLVPQPDHFVYGAYWVVGMAVNSASDLKDLTLLPSNP